MIYKVHFWYKKRNSRKLQNKCEVLVFAQDREGAIKLVENMISGLDIETEIFNVMGGILDKSLEEIYVERPELIGISPQRGYVYDELYHKNAIRNYLK